MLDRFADADRRGLEALAALWCGASHMD
jgi:hypothetical protein